MKKPLLVLPLLFLISACGKSVPTTMGKEQIFPTTYSNEPLILQKQNLNCLKKAFLPSLAEFNLHLFIQGSYENQTKNFSPLLQGIFLKNEKVISRSIFGEKVEVIFSKSGVRHATTKVASNVEICPETDEFLRETVESAALNTSYFIHKTNLKFTSVLPEIKIAPVSINISPAIIQSTLLANASGEIVKYSSYMTDNAFYMPSNHSLTFLPHSAQMKRNGLELNFWEVPMIASHEYGHHLFQMIFKDQSLNSLDFLNCFGHQRPRKKNQKSLRVRKVSVNDVLNSYNEGFADLISYYTLDPHERGIRGVKCLEVGRAVESPVFFNGKPKVFSKEALHSFFSSVDEARLGSCEDHNYQDTHVMGSIFAHNADMFLSELTNSDDEKLAALVDWVKYLRSEKKRHNLIPAKIYLKETLSTFINMGLKKFNRALDQKICSRIKMIYPDLDKTECGDETNL